MCSLICFLSNYLNHYVLRDLRGHNNETFRSHFGSKGLHFSRGFAAFVCLHQAFARCHIRNRVNGLKGCEEQENG
jgi:hypothetical protein